MTSIALTTYVGPAGDHNDRAMEAVRLVGTAMARHLNVEPTVIGEPVPSDPQSWEIELERARDSLEEMAARVEAVVSAGQVPVCAITRCAVALATQPVSFHLDCDVLEPGLVKTDYQVPEGLSLEGLRDCAEAAARSEIVGVEVAEFEGEGRATADELVDALAPLFSS